jgi:pimeloyl-ACP methyl ester carboxylesterase
MAALVPHLRPHCNILVWDHLGHGYSPKPLGATHRKTRAMYTMGCLADAVHQLVDSLGRVRAPYYVFGHSMGGMVALEYAVRYAGEIAGAVFASTSAFNAFPEARQKLEALRAAPGPKSPDAMRADAASNYTPGFAKTHPEFVEATVQSKLLCPPEVTLALLENMIEIYDPRPGLATLRVPALVLHGECDPTIPLPLGQALAALLPDAELVVFPGQCHEIHKEVPAEVARAVVARFGL